MILLSPGSLYAQTAAIPPARPLVFTHVTVIDVTGSPSKSDMTVIFAGKRIAAVGRTGRVRIPKGAQIIHASGKFLIPGLWDMHTHTLREERVGALFPHFIANGVTGIRDMAMPLEKLKQLEVWRREIQEGRRVGPRIFASGATVGGVSPQHTFTLATEAEARQAVVALKQRGADFIKVYSLLPRPLFFVVADEARKQRLTFAGHVPVSVTATEASDAGQKSMEHLYGILGILLYQRGWGQERGRAGGN